MSDHERAEYYRRCLVAVVVSAKLSGYKIIAESVQKALDAADALEKVAP